MTPKAMINTFEPKALTEATENTTIRSSVMGAACLGQLKMLPKSDQASIIWEASRLLSLIVEEFEGEKCVFSMLTQEA